MILSHFGLKNRLIFGAANYTFLESLGPGQYNKTIFKMFYNCFKDFCNQCEYRELLRRIILHVTYSQYLKELSISVTFVNKEMLYRVSLYVTYSLYMKRLSMTVTDVNIELACLIESLHEEYSLCYLN